MKFEKPTKQTIILCFMIWITCLLCFVVGYGYGFKKSVNYANNFIIENCPNIDFNKGFNVPEDWKETLALLNLTEDKNEYLMEDKNE